MILRSFVFRRLDALGNFHLLLARQQRHRAHLLEIHPHRVVQRVQPAVVFRPRPRPAGLTRSTSAWSTISISSSRSLAKTSSSISGVDNSSGSTSLMSSKVRLPLLLREPDEFLDFFRRSVDRRRRSRRAVGGSGRAAAAVSGFEFARGLRLLTYDNSLPRRATEARREYEKPRAASSSGEIRRLIFPARCKCRAARVAAKSFPPCGQPRRDFRATTPSALRPSSARRFSSASSPPSDVFQFLRIAHLHGGVFARESSA